MLLIRDENGHPRRDTIPMDHMIFSTIQLAENKIYSFIKLLQVESIEKLNFL